MSLSQRAVVNQARYGFLVGIDANCVGCNELIKGPKTALYVTDHREGIVKGF